jgi:hypothetical protein
MTIYGHGVLFHTMRVICKYIISSRRSSFTFGISKYTSSFAVRTCWRSQVCVLMLDQHPLYLPLPEHESLRLVGLLVVPPSSGLPASRQ